MIEAALELDLFNDSHGVDYLKFDALAGDGSPARPGPRRLRREYIGDTIESAIGSDEDLDAMLRLRRAFKPLSTWPSLCILPVVRPFVLLALLILLILA